MSEKPEKLWLIIGQRPARKLHEYSYTTNPYHYRLPDLPPKTDEEYRAVSRQVKAFIDKDDAIDFVYETGLMLTRIIGYRLIDGAYVEDEEVTDEVLDTDW